MYTAKAPSQGLPLAWHQDAYYAYASPDYLPPHYSGANVSAEVRVAYPIGYSIPGIMFNEHQRPVLRGGRPV